MKDRALIAVVDDDASVCKSLERMLRAAQMDVLTYKSGADFLSNGERRNPDCLVLDVKMPEMSGIELRDCLKTHAHPAPVVFITAHDDAETRSRALGGGATAYLSKPFSDEELLAAIARALERTNGSAA